MKYFALKPSNSVVVKWSDDRTADFTANSAVSEEVDDIVSQFELLREFDTPIYTVERLKFFFPDMREISEDEHTGMVDSIGEYNVIADEIAREVESETTGNMSTYVSMFAAKYPNLLSYREVSELVAAFNDLREAEEESIEEDSFNEDGDDLSATSPEERSEEFLKAIYSMLRSVEKTGDPTVVKTILRLVGD